MEKVNHSQSDRDRVVNCYPLLIKDVYVHGIVLVFYIHEESWCKEASFNYPTVSVL